MEQKTKNKIDELNSEISSKEKEIKDADLKLEK